MSRRRRQQGGASGILVVDKPDGWTSHDVVARVRRLTGQRRAGHTGTLDPSATGVLVVCLGQATRLVEYMTGHDKRYAGTIVLGRETTTDDAEGAVVRESPVPAITNETLRNLEARFTGQLDQVPPAYSAISISGRRAHELARVGATPELAPRRVVVHSLSLQQEGNDRLQLTVHCGPGTYVRSLARDIGRVLGCGAHLAGLRRTASGPFSLADALPLPELEAAIAGGRLDEVLLAPDDGVPGLPAAILGPEHAAALGSGQAPRVVPVVPGDVGAVRVYDRGGAFIAMASLAASGVLRPLKVFVGPSTNVEAN